MSVSGAPASSSRSRSPQPELLCRRCDPNRSERVGELGEPIGTGRLSLGQRCTVVLPLLLAQDPDLAVSTSLRTTSTNAFVVETVVDVLRGRRADAQRVIATHNANIPVLGEADRVMVLGSSGRQAFIAQEGPLDQPAVVAAITRLMEGGAEAFRRRADFYGR